MSLTHCSSCVLWYTSWHHLPDYYSTTSSKGRFRYIQFFLKKKNLFVFKGMLIFMGLIYFFSLIWEFDIYFLVFGFGGFYPKKNIRGGIDANRCYYFLGLCINWIFFNYIFWGFLEEI